MSSWRIVSSSGGAFWLERTSAAGPGAPGESLYFASAADAHRAAACILAHLSTLEGYCSPTVGGGLLLERRTGKGARRG